jgi:hypothetical protein
MRQGGVKERNKVHGNAAVKGLDHPVEGANFIGGAGDGL